MVILEKVATMVAKYGTPLLVPTASAFVTPVAEETVKQGYLNAGVPENFNPTTSATCRTSSSRSRPRPTA
jgi:hypothetical protein